MSRHLDWNKANTALKPKLSVVDEHEYRSNDAAARWLGKTACRHCGSVLSAVTWECVRGRYCPGEKKGRRK